MSRRPPNIDLESILSDPPQGRIIHSPLSYINRPPFNDEPQEYARVSDPITGAVFDFSSLYPTVANDPALFQRSHPPETHNVFLERVASDLSSEISLDTPRSLEESAATSEIDSLPSHIIQELDRQVSELIADLKRSRFEGSEKVLADVEDFLIHKLFGEQGFLETFYHLEYTIVDFEIDVEKRRGPCYLLLCELEKNHNRFKVEVRCRELHDRGGWCYSINVPQRDESCYTSYIDDHHAWFQNRENESAIEFFLLGPEMSDVD